MTIETRAEFARRCGVNRATVTRWADAGKLVLLDDGRVDAEASLHRLAETRGGRGDVAARHAAQRGAAIPTPQGGRKNAPAADTVPAPAGFEADGGRAKWQRIGLHFGNQQIKLDIALRRGLRYALDDAKREALGLGATVRAAVERLIDQTAPRLAVMDDPLARRLLLGREIARIRRMVRGELPRALRRMRQAAKVGADGTAA